MYRKKKLALDDVTILRLQWSVVVTLPSLQSCHINVTGSNFEITFVSEKHVVEDDVLFTNHLAGK